MNTVSYIAAFLKVAQLGGFTAAANALAISVPAVSKQIQALERELGVTLFERSTRRISLTSIGEIYYQEVLGAFSALEQADNAVAASKSDPFGVLHVMSSRYFAQHIILPRMPAFAKKYPKVILDLQIAEQIPHLLDDGLDIMFGVSVAVTSNSVQKKITSTRYVFCASPDYLAHYGTPQNPFDLMQHRYLTHSMRKPNNSWVFANGERVVLQPALMLNDASALADCAKRGLGVTALHHYQVADALSHGELVEILTAYRMPEIPVYLYYHPSRYMQPKVRLWIDAMCDPVNLTGSRDSKKSG